MSIKNSYYSSASYSKYIEQRLTLYSPFLRGLWEATVISVKNTIYHSIYFSSLSELKQTMRIFLNQNETVKDCIACYNYV